MKQFRLEIRKVGAEGVREVVATTILPKIISAAETFEDTTLVPVLLALARTLDQQQDVEIEIEEVTAAIG